MKTYTGAQLVVRYLQHRGITQVAGIPGGANLPLYHALAGSSIRHILARHEQGAGFIAQGMARATGKPAVCLATAGPGATNLVTAIADAYRDSVPLIAITGQVPLALMGTDAFQEIDICAMAGPVTRATFLVESAGDLRRVLPEAFAIATSLRPGPVLIDIPRDVQMEEVPFGEWDEPRRDDAPFFPGEYDLARMALLINRSERPLLYIGGGVIASGAPRLLSQLARKNSIPVVSTLMGLGCFPQDDPRYLGMLGMHGTPAANRALAQADLLIALGVRFDDRATGRLSRFCPDASIIHVDIDPAELNKLRRASLSIKADIGAALNGILPRVERSERSSWMARVAALADEHPMPPHAAEDPRDPRNIIGLIAGLMPRDGTIVTDVGQHQMWTAQYYPFTRPRSFLTSGGLGTMGFGLPAAIGASLASPGSTVTCISGDGSIMMNIQELATLAEYRPNVKIIIMNNRHLGLVRQQQELFYGQVYIASRIESQPDFAALARDFGIAGYRVDEGDSPFEALEDALRQPGPALVDVPVNPGQNVLPMVAPGCGNDEMIGVHAQGGK